MEVRAFFACEKAVPRANGSIDVLGFGIRNMRLRKKANSEYAQVIINFLCLLKFSAIESGQKAIQIAFVSADGESLSKSPVFNIQVPEKNSVFDVTGDRPLKVKESGIHDLNLVINNRIEAVWPIDIKVEETESDQQ